MSSTQSIEVFKIEEDSLLLNSQAESKSIEGRYLPYSSADSKMEKKKRQKSQQTKKRILYDDKSDED